MRTILADMEERSTAVAGHAEPAALAARLRVAGWRFARRMRRESSPGISPTLSAALHTVESQGPITAGQLAAYEHVQKPTMTRTIQAMLDRGLVERIPDPLDGRVSWLSVTAEEREVLETAASLLERLAEGDR